MRASAGRTEAVWAALLLTNLRSRPTIPWAVAAMAVILWAEWNYLNGRGGPTQTADARHRLLRERNPARNVRLRHCRRPAFGRGVDRTLDCVFSDRQRSWKSLTRFLQVSDAHRRPVARDGRDHASRHGRSGLSRISPRYTRTAIRRRRRHSVRESRLAPAHGVTQGFAWATVVFYLLADGTFGALARLTQSIVPGIVVHAVGLLTFFALVWPYDATRRMVRTEGPDAWFWIQWGRRSPSAASRCSGSFGSRDCAKPTRPADVSAAETRLPCMCKEPFLIAMSF
jgi:hypothetical protein